MIIAERTRGLGTVIALLVCPSLAPASDPATQVAPAHSRAGALSALLSQPPGARHQAVAWTRPLGRSRLACVRPPALAPAQSLASGLLTTVTSKAAGRWHMPPPKAKPVVERGPLKSSRIAPSACDRAGHGTSRNPSRTLTSTERLVSTTEHAQSGLRTPI